MFRELKCVMDGKLYNIRYFVRAVTELLKWKMNNKWPTVYIMVKDYILRSNIFVHMT